MHVPDPDAVSVSAAKRNPVGLNMRAEKGSLTAMGLMALLLMVIPQTRSPSSAGIVEMLERLLVGNRDSGPGKVQSEVRSTKIGGRSVFRFTPHRPAAPPALNSYVSLTREHVQVSRRVLSSRHLQHLR